MSTRPQKSRPADVVAKADGHPALSNDARADKLDRFGPGPWVDEPDRLEWKHGELYCVISRHQQDGYLQGFVGLPPTHSLFGKSHADLPAIEAHGGLTYSAGCSHCGVWWLGFDCGHVFDLRPVLSRSGVFRPGQGGAVASLVNYKDVAFAKLMVDMLAVQLVMHDAEVQA